MVSGERCASDEPFMRIDLKERFLPWQVPENQLAVRAAREHVGHICTTFGQTGDAIGMII